MIKNVLIQFFIIFLIIKVEAQVGIGTTNPSPSSILDIESDSKGVLIPRISLTSTHDVTTVENPVTSTLIYNTTTTSGTHAVIPSFYYWDGTKWVILGTDAAKYGWLIYGNQGTNNDNFLGTRDNIKLSIRTNNTEKIRITTKGQIETYNTDNSVLIGENAGNLSNYNGTLNSIFIGKNAALNNTTGIRNNIIGVDAFTSNISGIENVVIGTQALQNNTNGNGNIAIGQNAGNAITSGVDNIAIGRNSGPNTPWVSNTIAIGPFSTTTAYGQVRIGNTNTVDIGGYSSWSNLSDKRFKYDIKYNVPGLSFVSKLKPVTYKINRDKLNEFLGITYPKGLKSAKETIQTGFLAQDVVNSANQINYKFSGVTIPSDNTTDHYSIKYAEFVVPLVKAVQELNHKIILLEEEIARLKKNNSK